MPIRILGNRDVERCLPYHAAIELMESAFKQLSAGQAVVPVRHTLPAGDHLTALSMPAYLEDSACLGMKWISIRHPGNKYTEPGSIAQVLVFDANIGALLGILDARSLTAIRTAAGAAYAADVLAPEGPAVVALFGGGHIAEAQLEAMACVREIQKVFVYTRSVQTSEAFAARVGSRLGLEISAMPDRARIREANIILTATHSTLPVFSDDEIGSDVHISGVGSYRLDMAEVPAETVARATVVVDHIESAMQEAGDVVQALTAGLIEKSSIYALGDPAIPRHPKGISFFKSVGNAVQDVICGQHVLEEAERLGLGTVVDF